ncbi:dimethyladenosine transferase 2, mitochondrial isoform X2 [Meles meles]|uniref:dimethyladenosine transferase 2, mitochondrial isoform X2 n=1 Tax=Meles meles TaxID=9662 RepID=UPI001E69A8A4|nr:dimethyladenosine transferase 2, mitochondrial isoform X2 [Meles meles]
MSVPVAGLPRRLALSALAGAGRFCVLGSGATRWRGVSGGHRRGLADLQPKLVPPQGLKDSNSWLPKYRSERKSYITNPTLAATLVRILKEEAKSPDQLFLECNPGPGILTQALLESKAKVIALESNRTFLPHLEKLVADPRNPHLYQALSVLWQVACKIKLLHVEPWSSFGVYRHSGGQEKMKNKIPLAQTHKQVGENMCLIQLTPLQNLFTENLTSVNYDIFFHMLKQCFMKRNFRLMDHLQLLSPVNATAVLKEMGKHGDMKITDLYPQDFKQLFETIEGFKESCRWLFDDCMEEMIM